MFGWLFLAFNFIPPSFLSIMCIDRSFLASSAVAVGLRRRRSRWRPSRPKGNVGIDEVRPRPILLRRPFDKRQRVLPQLNRTKAEWYEKEHEEMLKKEEGETKKKEEEETKEKEEETKEKEEEGIRRMQGENLILFESRLLFFVVG
jgi:hypothetical protein